MIGKFIKGKVYVFIDVANIFYSQRTLKWRISYKKLMKYLKRECNLGKCFVYTGIFKENHNQERFLKMLQKCGYILRTKPVKKITTREGHLEWKADFDVELSFDMDDLSEGYDTAILLSGDSDFAYILKRIKKKRKRVIVMSTRGHISLELLKEAKFVDLRKLKDEIAL
ncbi:MAG: NYN domain-containing protein [Candidatus Paceibacterales bacterium]